MNDRWRAHLVALGGWAVLATAACAFWLTRPGPSWMGFDPGPRFAILLTFGLAAIVAAVTSLIVAGASGSSRGFAIAIHGAALVIVASALLILSN